MDININKNINKILSKLFDWLWKTQGDYDNDCVSDPDRKPVTEGSFAEITDGKLVRFDNHILREFADAFDCGLREPENATAKLCTLLLDVVAMDVSNLLLIGGHDDEDRGIIERYIKKFSISFNMSSDVT